MCLSHGSDVLAMSAEQVTEILERIESLHINIQDIRQVQDVYHEELQTLKDTVGQLSSETLKSNSTSSHGHGAIGGHFVDVNTQANAVYKDSLRQPDQASNIHLPDQATPASVTNSIGNPGPTHSAGLQADTNVAAAGADFDLQGQFTSLRDSLTRVVLPADLKLNESRTGVRRDDQPLYNVISKSAKYVETAFKWLSLQDPATGVSENSLAQLNLILKAHLEYVKDEYQALLVQSTFDKDTSKLFRSMQKNTSGFTPQALSTLHRAVEISAARQAQPQSTGYRGGNSRGYSRGYGRGRYRNNNNYYNNFDQYQSFGERGFPAQRGGYANHGGNNSA